MKKSLFILFSFFAAAAALLSSCSAKDSTITVMSYNVRMGVANDGENSWENRKAATPAMLADCAPDVFGVQEAFDFQLDYIEQTSPAYKWVGVGRDDGKTKGEYMAVFYNAEKIELLDWGTYWLSETPEVPSRGWDAACRRTATWTLLKIKENGKKFWFVNTHLDHVGKQARANGLQLIVDRIDGMNTQEKLPMVLTGDFNVTPDDPCLVELDKRMKSARAFAIQSDEKPSFNGFKAPKSVIDYIYFSEFSECGTFRVVDSEYAGCPFISDHYPILATLKF